MPIRLPAVAIVLPVIANDLLDAAAELTAASYLALKALAAKFTNEARLTDEAKIPFLTPATPEVNPAIAIEQLRLIELNIQRWQRLPHHPGNFYILVNIPGYYLDVMENDRLVRRFRIVVGRPDWPTPEFQTVLKQMVLHPAWNVPLDIATKEVIPALRKHPRAYADAKDIHLFAASAAGPVEIAAEAIDWSLIPPDSFPYRLMQFPGRNNPLGQVKFVLQDPFDIHIHDTPAKQLFESADRGLSHGCIRVEHAGELAKLLLDHDDPSWTQARFDKMLADADESWLRLVSTVPVYVVYFTVWIDPDATVQWRPDIYGCDVTQAAVPCQSAAMAASKIAGG